MRRLCLLAALLSLCTAYSADYLYCRDGYRVEKHEANGKMLRLVRSDNYPRLTSQPCSMQVWGRFSLVVQSEDDVHRWPAGVLVVNSTTSKDAHKFSREFTNTANNTGIVYAYSVEGVVSIIFRPTHPTRFSVWIIDEFHPKVTCPILSWYADLFLIRQKETQGVKNICSHAGVRHWRFEHDWITSEKLMQVLYPQHATLAEAEVRYVNGSQGIKAEKTRTRLIEYMNVGETEHIRGRTLIFLRSYRITYEKPLRNVDIPSRELTVKIWNPVDVYTFRLDPLESCVIHLMENEILILRILFATQFMVQNGTEIVVQVDREHRQEIGHINVHNKLTADERLFTIHKEDNYGTPIVFLKSNRLAAIGLHGVVEKKTGGAVSNRKMIKMNQQILLIAKRMHKLKYRRWKVPYFCILIIITFILLLLFNWMRIKLLQCEISPIPKIELHLPPALEAAIQAELRKHGELPRID